MEKLIPATAVPLSKEKRDALIRSMQQTTGSSLEEIEKEIELSLETKIFKNDIYTVHVNDDHPDIIWLSIKRNDQAPIKDWRDFQEIKNQIVGYENEAVELYPAESRLVDTANQYHLWVIKDPTFRFPFGFNERWVLDEVIDPQTGVKQRKRT